MILHLIQQSPNQDRALACCLPFVQNHDTIMLLGDSINALLLGEWQNRLQPLNVRMLTVDVQARGLTQRLSHCTQISYQEFVSLSLNHSKVISW
ncbi:sulfurtransferase complex subunit TusB [Shewanella colwelliana]|uniref:sulfurtransferase complex subunit TusB n=1 Tax=Shewanella colwelliana TaxID=23 RepID=UPI00048EB504|nr:sulfurtransferase complex subunit TusB [Shewanella colwelliana]MDX1282367.1 sulfurtransferase complex subunit TusB [Shewanella colwelliana]